MAQADNEEFAARKKSGKQLLRIKGFIHAGQHFSSGHCGLNYKLDSVKHFKVISLKIISQYYHQMGPNCHTKYKFEHLLFCPKIVQKPFEAA